MAKARGFSLWLIPSGETYSNLDREILYLSRKYNTPYFNPHVTLIGEVLGSEEEITLKTAELASRIQPYTIELKKVEALDDYFRCLFIQAKETTEIIRANSEARKIFNRQTDQKYTPHLSLMYGSFSPKIKKEIISEVGKERSIRFNVNSIFLLSTKGEPEDWYKIKEFVLK